jgi:hypothetical protein
MNIYINKDELLRILESKLESIGYIKSNYLIDNFLNDDKLLVFYLGGFLGKGFRITKYFDDYGMYVKYSQYPEYETIQSFAWITNRNKELNKFRIKL